MEWSEKSAMKGIMGNGEEILTGKWRGKLIHKEKKRRDKLHKMDEKAQEQHHFIRYLKVLVWHYIIYRGGAPDKNHTISNNSPSSAHEKLPFKLLFGRILI